MPYIMIDDEDYNTSTKTMITRTQNNNKDYGHNVIRISLEPMKTTITMTRIIATTILTTPIVTMQMI